MVAPERSLLMDTLTQWRQSREECSPSQCGLLTAGEYTDCSKHLALSRYGMVIAMFLDPKPFRHHRVTLVAAEGRMLLPMDRQPVNSSNLVSVGYDEHSHLLEVEFHNGTVCQYQHVPPAVFRSLMSAPSVGSFFNSTVRKGPYPWVQVR
jgi:hypothetical protein